MNDGIGVTVCHDRVTGVDERDNNPTAIQNSGPDGSLLRFYRDERGVVVTHVRTDGVLVRVEQNGSQKFNQQDLTELATDGRLTF
jgi:hypothetical protein